MRCLRTALRDFQCAFRERTAVKSSAVRERSALFSCALRSEKDRTLHRTAALRTAHCALSGRTAVRSARSAHSLPAVRAALRAVAKARTGSRKAMAVSKRDQIISA